MPSFLSQGWEPYSFPPAFVLGFHGCDRKIGEAVLQGKEKHLRPSENVYDWLGTGIYFWEANPLRALEFAQERASGANNSRGQINDPFVIGAIIKMGLCLDMCNSHSLREMKMMYRLLQSIYKSNPDQLPQNGKRLRQRKLDCAVINLLHQERENMGQQPYDTVKANFWEGDALYPHAGFREQDHIQICVRSTSSILGYFRPIDES